jgi:hypothetical protein
VALIADAGAAFARAVGEFELAPFSIRRYHGVMPLSQFIGAVPLSTDDFDAINKAFSEALKKLGISLKDPMAEIAARRIIDAALAGERDHAKLTEIGVGVS